MSTLPTIFVVHGSWHTPEHYKPLTDRLSALGYPTVCPQLPTTGTPPLVATVQTDAALVRAQLDQLLEEGKEVVVILHSYGGVVGTEAAAGLGLKDRQKNGQSGGVIGLFYMAAFILAAGESLLSMCGGKVPPHLEARDDGTVIPRDPTRFYSDIEPSEQQHWVSLQQQFSEAAWHTPLTRTAYSDIPTAYLFCEKDPSVPGHYDLVAARKKEGVKIREFSIQAGHSPFISQVDETVKALETAIAEWKSV